MSIHSLSRVWDQSQQRGTNLLLLLAMADRADENGVLWAGTAWLSRRARMSRRNLIRVIQELEQSGELIIVRARRDNGQTVVNHYIVTAGADQATLDRAWKHIDELMEMRSGSIVDKGGEGDTTTHSPEGGEGDTTTHSPEGGEGDTMTHTGVTPRHTGRVTPRHGEGDTMTHDPSSYPLREDGEDDPPLPSASDLWRVALSDLGYQMPEATYRKLLDGSSAAWDDHGRYVITVRNQSAADWMRAKLDNSVRRTLAESIGAAEVIYHAA